MAALTHTDHPTATADSPRPSRAGYRMLSVLVLLLCAYLAIHYVAATAGAGVAAATQLGRDYGLAGVLLFLVAALYPLRRFVYRARAGSLEWWYRAHLLVGLLALALLGCHSGLAFRSMFLGALQLAFWGTVLTGLFGYLYQWSLTRWMRRHEFRPTVAKELEAACTSLLATLEERAGAKPAFDGARREVERRRKLYLWPFRDPAFWSEQVRAACAGTVSVEEQALIEEWNQAEVMRSYHRFLRGWTTWHLLFTVAAVQLVLWHLWLVATNPR